MGSTRFPASVTPDTVETLPGPPSVTVTDQAEDSGSGVSVSAFRLRAATIDTGTPSLGSGSHVVAGTPADGTWSGTIDLPQGLPPGTCYVQVFANDNDGNSTIYMGSGFPDNWLAGVPDTDPTGRSAVRSPGRRATRGGRSIVLLATSPSAGCPDCGR